LRISQKNSPPAHTGFNRITETGMSKDELDGPEGEGEEDFGAGSDEGDGTPEGAKLWSSVMTDLRKVIRQSGVLRGEHDLIRAVLGAVGPRLRGLCAQYSKTQISLWKTAKATKTTCDFVSVMRPTVTGLLSVLNLPPTVKKADLGVLYTSILQSRDRETKGVRAREEGARYAGRDLLKPWAQGLDMEHEIVGALTESSDLAVLGAAPLTAEGAVPPPLPSVTAAEFFTDDVAVRSERADRLIASADSMCVYEKTAMKDINHLLLRFMEQTKFKHMESLDRVAALEATITEYARLEKENQARIAADRLVEIKEDALQAYVNDRKKLDVTLKALAAEKEVVAGLKADVTKLELELMNADRELLKIPELSKKLATVAEIQTETQASLAALTQDRDRTAAELLSAAGVLEETRSERAALQAALSMSRHAKDQLDVDLAGMEELQRATSVALEALREQDFARRERTAAVACQHMPDKTFSVDLGIQTEFMYPPLTLRQRLGSAMPGSSSGAGSQCVQQPLFPTITVSCGSDNVNALSTTSAPRASTSAMRRGATAAGGRAGRRGQRSGSSSVESTSLFHSLSQPQSVPSNSHGYSHSSGGREASDIDAELNSLFGGPSIRSVNSAAQQGLGQGQQHARTAGSVPVYSFGGQGQGQGQDGSRSIRTTGNPSQHHQQQQQQTRQRAIGLSLPLVAPTDGSDDCSTNTPAPLDSDRSLRSHLSITQEGVGTGTGMGSSSMNMNMGMGSSMGGMPEADTFMSDELSPDDRDRDREGEGEGRARYSPELNMMSQAPSRVGTSHDPPQGQGQGQGQGHASVGSNSSFNSGNSRPQQQQQQQQYQQQQYQQQQYQQQQGQQSSNNIPPSSPIRGGAPHPMSYTEQLEFQQRQQADSTRPQVNPLSPLVLQAQPRSHEDLVLQSPSRKNGGAGQAAAGVALLSRTFSNISTSGVDSVFSQDSPNGGGGGGSGSFAGRAAKSRAGPKIITGVPGQDPMSVNAYRKFVGSAAPSQRNKNF
jgi:hypothetical protein